jgi:hypothetical protein
MMVNWTFDGTPSLDEIDMARRIHDKLAQCYPGHVWGVNVDATGGIVDIRNFGVSYGYGYRLLLTTVYSDPGLRCVVMAGGEILERARLARGVSDGSQAVHIDGVPDKHQPIGGIIQ